MVQYTNFFFLNYQILKHQNFELQKKAKPEPMAILIEIISEKLVEIIKSKEFQL